MTSKKVLFISHDASRTGAPISLLSFLKWFRDNASIPFRIILKSGGELEYEFEALGRVDIFNNEESSRRLTKRIPFSLPRLQKFENQSRHNSLKKDLIRDNIGLIYSNTITNGQLLEFLSSLKCPVISHVSELDFWIRYRMNSKDLMLVKDYTDYYIAVSEIVRDNLIKNHGIPEDRVEVVSIFTPTLISDMSIVERAKQQIREQLNIDQEMLIVGGCGTTDWRKGPDVFIQLARTLYHKQPDISVHFVWVGGDSQGLQFRQLCHDVKHIGLDNYVHFIGVKTNPLDYFAAFDVFALTSREEPMGLVCIEVASVCKPIVCFDGPVGTREFVEDDCGFVVPYLDIDTMASKLLELLNSVELRQRLGRRAAQKVRERHNIKVSAPRILDIINRFISKPQNSPL